METDLNEVTYSVGNSSTEEENEMQLCHNCKNIVYANYAKRFCIKCEEKLCISCSQVHETMSKHLVVALNEQEETKKFKESNFCRDHEERLAEMYCAYCKKIICSECENESHSSHNCSRVEDVADFVSKQTEAEYENLFDIQLHFDKERDKLFNERMKVMKTVKEMEKEIRKRCDDITTFVCNETNALLKELDVFKKERLEEIEMERKKMEEHAFTFEKFKEYCDQTKSNTNPRYTCEAEGVLRNIVDDLKTRPEGRWKSRLLQIQFSISKSDIEQVLTYLGDAVGKLIIRCPYKMTQSSEVKLDVAEVCGMARLHDKLYVLSNSISIRRLQDPFVSVDTIETPGILIPKDIVSCSKTSCLYIPDNGADCVWKIAIPSRRVSRWLSEVKEPSALSVTSNAELLMLRNNRPVCLEVYNEHAILVRRFQLPATIPSLRRLYETPSGKFIGLGEQSVFTFRRNGSIISQFEPSKHMEYRGNPQGLCLSPYHIFLYSGSTCTQKGRFALFNSFSNNYRPNINTGTVSSLTLDLTSHQILVDKSADWRIPVTSCYLKETKQILVLEEIASGNNKTWSLKAYDVLPE